MAHVSEANGRICFTERMSPALRLLAIIAGLFPFLAPYELLLRPGWQGFSLLIVVPLLISLGAVAIGLVFILSGVLGLNQTLRFDAASGTVSYAYETSLTPLRVKRYSFGEVVGIEVHVHDWESRPPTYGLQIAFVDGRTVQVGNFAQRDEAEQYMHRIEGLVG